MKTPRTLASGWDLFRTLAVPAGCDERQVGDMHACFYAGAATLLSAVNAITKAATDEGMTDEEGAEALAALDQEIRKFSSDLMESAVREMLAAIGAPAKDRP